MKFEDAVARIQSFVNTRYDEQVVAAFSEACADGQIRPGSVRLKKRTAQERTTSENGLEVLQTGAEEEPEPVAVG
jgi:hypothetical protein